MPRNSPLGPRDRPGYKQLQFHRFQLAGSVPDRLEAFSAHAKTRRCLSGGWWHVGSRRLSCPGCPGGGDGLRALRALSWLLPRNSEGTKASRHSPVPGRVVGRQELLQPCPSTSSNLGGQRGDGGRDTSELFSLPFPSQFFCTVLKCDAGVGFSPSRLDLAVPFLPHFCLQAIIDQGAHEWVWGQDGPCLCVNPMSPFETKPTYIFFPHTLTDGLTPFIFKPPLLRNKQKCHRSRVFHAEIET